jgi:transposase
VVVFVRQWACAACGTVHDRDVNAARNILALGRRERLNAAQLSRMHPAWVETTFPTWGYAGAS